MSQLLPVYNSNCKYFYSALQNFLVEQHKLILAVPIYLSFHRQASKEGGSNDMFCIPPSFSIDALYTLRFRSTHTGSQYNIQKPNRWSHARGKKNQAMVRCSPTVLCFLKKRKWNINLTNKLIYFSICPKHKHDLKHSIPESIA